MHNYVVTGMVARLCDGLLVLSEKQFNDRKHNLERLESDSDGVLCRIIHPVEFKRGEQLKHDAMVSKSLSEIIKNIDVHEVVKTEDSKIIEPQRPVLKIKKKY